MEETKSKIKKTIETYLSRMADKLVSPIDFFRFSKKGISEKEIQEILIDYALKTDTSTLNNLNRSLFFNYKFLAELLKDDKTKEKVINLYRKYDEIYDISKEINSLLMYSDFNLYFFIGLEGFYDFVRHFPSTAFRSLLKYVTDSADWDKPQVKKFFVYFFDNPAYVEGFEDDIKNNFKGIGESLQKFLINKGFLNSIEPAYPKNWLNSEQINDEIKDLMINKIKDDIREEDIKVLVRFYINIPEKYQKMIFPTEKEFYEMIGKYDVVDEVLDVLDDILPPERVGLFFKYNPNFINRLQTEDEKVKVKYGIDGVPEEIKSSIDLPMEEMAKFDGEDIASMFYENRDGYTDWIKHYVDGDLYDKSLYWDYNPDQSTIKQYYWDYLTPQNLEKIKEILKKENPDLDLTDKDALQEAAFEDGEVGSVLHSAAANGERNGDEAQLIMDIRRGIDELFGKGNWKLEDDKVFAKISLHQFNEDFLRYSYNDCGEWYIKCMFLDIWKDYMDRRERPSLPDYRYGIQGDFDKDEFNDYIEGNL